MAGADNDVHLFLAQTPAGQGLEESFLRALVEGCRFVELQPGDRLFRGGDVGDVLYLVLEGMLHAFIERDGQQILIGHVALGETLGEFSFLTGNRNQETAIATAPTRLAAVSAAVFDAVSLAAPEAALEFRNRLRRRIEHWHFIHALYRSSLFRELDLEVLLELQSEIQPLNLAGGDYLFREGDAGEELYLLVSGRLQVTAPDGGDGERSSEVAPGETVGESNVLGSPRRSCSVRAIRDSILAGLSRQGFERIFQRHPASSLVFFTRRLVESERAAARPRSSLPARTVTVVPAHADFPTAEFTRQLAACLGSGPRSALVLDARTVDEALGHGLSQCPRGSSREGLLMSWLNAKELEHDCVFLIAEPGPSAWTQRTLRQADRILLVADGDRAPRPECFRALALSNQQPASLVLVHAPGVTPRGTQRWLSVYSFERHFHLRRDELADMLRLSRYLSGREVGLVLGGGFARGIAHTGVLRALREAGVPVDVIGGTSMGSMIALMHVYGFSDQDMLRVLREQGDSALRDLTFPIVALLNGKRVRRSVEALAGGRMLEDLPLPAFCVATDLTNGCLAVLASGEVSEAVLASTRVPGMFPPVVRGNRLLVDGGLVSNVPADVMRGRCSGCILSVDISPETDFAMSSGCGSDVSGWQLLRRKLNPFATKVTAPSIASVLMRSMSFDSKSYRRRMRELSDLYLTPPTAGFRFNDFARGEEMAQLGYEYAAAEVRRWLRQRHS